MSCFNPLLAQVYGVIFRKELAWLNDQENAKFLGFQKIRMLDSEIGRNTYEAAGYSSFFFLSKN